MLIKLNSEKQELPGHPVPGVRIADASFPAPFRSGLEYSSPARGTWNIVHTGMLIPEAHEIFVCAAGCLRGVVLTAAEMGLQDRFSTVAVREHNLLDGDMEELVIEGVSDIIEKLPKRPPAVLVYTSCVHHFAGCDLDMIYDRLRRRYPGIDFTDCYMNPIMRKSGLTPDQLMRSRLYMLLHERKKDPRAVAIIGNDLPACEDSDLMILLRRAGCKVHEITSCRNYGEYQEMGESSVYISYNPDAVPGGEMLSERLGGRHHYMQLSYDPEEIDAEFTSLAETLSETISGTLSETFTETVAEGFAEACRTGIESLAAPGKTAAPLTEELPGRGISENLAAIVNDIRKKGRAAAEDAATRTRELIGDTEIAIDSAYSPRPMGLAKMLLDSGFNVVRVYVDGIPAADREAFRYLQENYPQLMLHPTVHTGMRFAQTENRIRHELSEARSSIGSRKESRGEAKESFVLAVGQKAAYFENTDHFVNVIEGGGMIGYQAITGTLELMRDAYLNKKDMKALVQIKGLGCEVCCR